MLATAISPILGSSVSAFGRSATSGSPLVLPVPILSITTLFAVPNGAVSPTAVCSIGVSVRRNAPTFQRFNSIGG